MILEMSNRVIEITNSKEYDAFKKNHTKGIIFYGADWCHACQQITPLYNRIANHYNDLVAFSHADIQRCGVDFSKVPVFIAYHNGKQINSMLGADSEGLKDFVKEVVQFKSEHTPKPLEKVPVLSIPKSSSKVQPSAPQKIKSPVRQIKESSNKLQKEDKYVKDQIRQPKSVVPEKRNKELAKRFNTVIPEKQPRKPATVHKSTKSEIIQEIGLKKENQKRF